MIHDLGKNFKQYNLEQQQVNDIFATLLTEENVFILYLYCYKFIFLLKKKENDSVSNDQIAGFLNLF